MNKGHERIHQASQETSGEIQRIPKNSELYSPFSFLECIPENGNSSLSFFSISLSSTSSSPSPSPETDSICFFPLSLSHVPFLLFWWHDVVSVVGVLSVASFSRCTGNVRRKNIEQRRLMAPRLYSHFQSIPTDPGRQFFFSSFFFGNSFELNLIPSMYPFDFYPINSAGFVFDSIHNTRNR